MFKEKLEKIKIGDYDDALTSIYALADKINEVIEALKELKTKLGVE